MPKTSATLVEEKPATVAESPLTGTQLAEALSVFNFVIDRRSTVSILQCVRLVAAPGNLVISGTDLDQQLTCKLPFDGIAFETCVPCHTLRAAAESIGGERIAFFSSPKQLILRSTAGEFAISAFQACEYPTITRPSPEATFEFDRRALLQAVSTVRPAISREETRYYLNGICLTHRGGRIAFTATDGHRLHQKVISPAVADGEMPEVIISRQGIRCLIELLDRMDAPIIMEVSRLRASFAVENWTLEAKCIDGTYPDYSRVIPDKFVGSAALSSGDLAAGLKTIARLGTSSVNPAAIKLSEGLSFTNPEGLKFERKLSVQVEGEAPEMFGVNAAYLAEILATHVGATVHFHFSDATAASPIKITFDGDDDFLAVLMPMRV
jgi:DNA polymerase-3 subunit beta